MRIVQPNHCYFPLQTLPATAIGGLRCFLSYQTNVKALRYGLGAD